MPYTQIGRTCGAADRYAPPPLLYVTPTIVPRLLTLVLLGMPELAGHVGTLLDCLPPPTSHQWHAPPDRSTRPHPTINTTTIHPRHLLPSSSLHRWATHLWRGLALALGAEVPPLTYFSSVGSLPARWGKKREGARDEGGGVGLCERERER